jgi:hypothetical protein
MGLDSTFSVLNPSKNRVFFNRILTVFTVLACTAPSYHLYSESLKYFVLYLTARKDPSILLHGTARSAIEMSKSQGSIHRLYHYTLHSPE